MGEVTPIRQARSRREACVRATGPLPAHPTTAEEQAVALAAYQARDLRLTEDQRAGWVLETTLTAESHARKTITIHDTLIRTTP